MPNRGGRSRVHHYVPRLHLRPFAIPGTRKRSIWAYDKQTGLIRKHAIKTTAARLDYYAVPGRPDPNVVEDALGGIERETAPLIRKLLGLGPGLFALSPDARTILSIYFGLLYTRVPSHRTRTDEVADYMANVEADMRLSHPEGWPRDLRATGWTGTDEEAERLRLEWLADVREGRFRIRSDGSESLATIGIGATELAPVMAQMRWVVVRKEGFPYFVVGDSPVTVWATKPLPPWSGVGFLTDGAEVSVTLSPECVLLMSFSEPTGAPDFVLAIDEPYRMTGPTGLAMPYSYRQWVTADRFVYGRSAGDLEAVRLFCDPANRGMRPRQQEIHGGPKEWERYKPQA